MSYNKCVADDTKNITLRIPREVYDSIADDVEEVARELKKKRGGGHTSENAALVELIKEAVEARRATEDAHPSKKAARPR